MITNHAELKAFVLAQAALGSTIYGTRVAGRIYGPHAKQVRQNIMFALTGFKVPHSKCGANAVRDALFAHFAVPGDCLAERERMLQEILEAPEPCGCGRTDCPTDMQLAPSVVDVSTVSEYGLTQKLSKSVRCF